MEKLEQASSKNASASTRSQEDDCMNENGKNAKTPKDPHQQNSIRNCLSSRLTQQPTAASADPPPSDAKRESKPSSESTEQKMEKLGQASSKNASASTRSQEDDCMNENGKNAKTP